MKKVLCTLFVAVCCMAMAIPAQAQVSFGVKGGLNLSKMDWKVGNLDINNVKENSTGFFIGIEVPVNLKYSIGVGDMAAIFFAAGPDFYFNLKDVDIAGIDKKDAQVGLNLGAGVKLINHIQIGVNYQFALGNSFKIMNSDVKNKLNTWQISLAYMF